MGKHAVLFGLIFSVFLGLARCAHADAQAPTDLFYDVTADAFYWGATTATPEFTNTSASYGGNIDFRFRPGSGLDHFGLGIEYTTTNSGPVYQNTSGLFQTSVTGVNGGFPVSTGNGLSAFISAATYRSLGGKVKYYVPLQTRDLAVAAYADFFSVNSNLNVSSTVRFNEIGGGVEALWRITPDFQVGGFVDFDNNVGTGIPAQNVVRYETFARYMIPKTNFHVLAGYRGYNFYGFNNTFINGYIVGAGIQY